MIIDQDVSTPIDASSGSIGSPSFSRRSFCTQVTVQDGDTVAIGGFIQESTATASQGVPVLHRLPDRRRGVRLQELSARAAPSWWFS